MNGDVLQFIRFLACFIAATTLFIGLHGSLRNLPLIGRFSLGVVCATLVAECCYWIMAFETGVHHWRLLAVAGISTHMAVTACVVVFASLYRNKGSA